MYHRLHATLSSQSVSPSYTLLPPSLSRRCRGATYTTHTRLNVYKCLSDLRAHASIRETKTQQPERNERTWGFKCPGTLKAAAASLQHAGEESKEEIVKVGKYLYFGSSSGRTLLLRGACASCCRCGDKDPADCHRGEEEEANRSSPLNLAGGVVCTTRCCLGKALLIAICRHSHSERERARLIYDCVLEEEEVLLSATPASVNPPSSPPPPFLLPQHQWSNQVSVCTSVAICTLHCTALSAAIA